MHHSSAFAINDKETQKGFIQAHPFAMLIVNGDDWPVTAMTPMVLSDDGSELIGHVARPNPFWKAAQRVGYAAAIFCGAQAYVSPSLYPSKYEHGREVPTWNYLAIEVAGRIEVEDDPQSMRPYLDRLTEQMESDRDHPWAVSDAPTDYIEALQRGIVGLKLQVQQVRMVQKTSQNKDEREYDAVRDAFLNSPNSNEAALGAAMQKEP